MTVAPIRRYLPYAEFTEDYPVTNKSSRTLGPNNETWPTGFAGIPNEEEELGEDTFDPFPSAITTVIAPDPLDP